LQSVKAVSASRVTWFFGHKGWKESGQQQDSFGIRLGGHCPHPLAIGVQRSAVGAWSLNLGWGEPHPSLKWLGVRSSCGEGSAKKPRLPRFAGQGWLNFGHAPLRETQRLGSELDGWAADHHGWGSQVLRPCLEAHRWAVFFAEMRLNPRRLRLVGATVRQKGARLQLYRAKLAGDSRNDAALSSTVGLGMGTVAALRRKRRAKRWKVVAPRFTVGEKAA
jgi:hypothetical protein